MQVEQYRKVNERRQPKYDVEGEAGGELREHDLPVADGGGEEQFEGSGAAFLSEQSHRDDAGDGGEEPPEQDASGLCGAGNFGAAEQHLHWVLDAARAAFVEQREREVELQPGEHEEPEQGHVPDRAAEISGEFSSEKCSGSPHFLPFNVVR